MRMFIIIAVVFAGIAFAQTGNKKMNVAIFVYDNVEILDFGGPSEVFAATWANDDYAFNVYTIAVSNKPILSQRFITIVPEYTFENCPQPDIIVFPGGGTQEIVANESVINWVKEQSKHAKVILSVCTGAMILSKAGLLDGKEATTWYGAIERLKNVSPRTIVHSNTRFVDNGQVVTTAGVSAGIDGALHVVSRLFGEETAAATAKYMEYDKWKPGEGLIVKK